MKTIVLTIYMEAKMTIYIDLDIDLHRGIKI